MKLLTNAYAQTEAGTDVLVAFDQTTRRVTFAHFVFSEKEWRSIVDYVDQARVTEDAP